MTWLDPFIFVLHLWIIRNNLSNCFCYVFEYVQGAAKNGSKLFFILVVRHCYILVYINGQAQNGKVNEIYSLHLMYMLYFCIQPNPYDPCNKTNRRFGSGWPILTGHVRIWPIWVRFWMRINDQSESDLTRLPPLILVDVHPFHVWFSIRWCMCLTWVYGLSLNFLYHDNWQSTWRVIPSTQLKVWDYATLQCTFF